MVSFIHFNNKNPPVLFYLQETQIGQKRRICVLIMLVLLIPSTVPSTVSIKESITESSSLTNMSLSKKTCYKCFNCATFVAVQAKECDNPEEQFCSVRGKILNSSHFTQTFSEGNKIQHWRGDPPVCEQADV